MKRTCELCFHRCCLEEGQPGFCGARAMRGGRIVCENYGKLTSLALDPIEKKPLKRFFPGSLVLSVGSYGCNLRCPFCQNHGISMARGNELEMVSVTPEALVQKAQELIPQGNIGVAYTYNEPLVGFEFVRDVSRLVQGQGMKNVLVTNGTVNKKPLEELLPLIDAANIDLKGFNPAFYEWLGGDLNSVLQSIRMAAECCHLEGSTLIVPGKNDSLEEMEALASWLSGVDREIPLHITRFFPRYQLTDRPPTGVDLLEELAAIAAKHLRYVYKGNC